MATDTEQVIATTTDEGQPAPTTGSVPVTNADPAPKADERTFTQADIDKIVKDRLARESQKTKDKYADYDELRASAVRLAAIEEANKSDEQKRDEALETAQAAQEALKSENARLAQEAKSAQIKSAVVAKAVAMDFQDPSDAYQMLDTGKLELADDGTVAGLEEALDALGKAKPYLLRQQPKLSATNPARSSQEGEDDADRRARLYGVGNVPFGQHGGGMVHND